MLKNKNIFATILLLGLTAIPAFSDEILPDIEFPKPPAFRVGISEMPEKQYIEAEEVKSAKVEKSYAKLDNSQDAEINDYTYADLDLKRMSKEISQELEYDGQDMLSDLSLLWQGAAMQSETINFALYKLANPDADKPDEKSIKKVLTTIASMSTLVGAGIGNPIIAGTSLISGNVLGIMSQDTKALNYKYTKVNDADMIILIRKVEDLQQKTVDLYYDYMSAKKQVELIADLVNERQEKFEYAQSNNAPRELIVITDAYYRTALDKLRNAKSEFFSKRAALEQFVGNETLLQFEQELAARESGEKVATQTPQEQEAQNEEYSKTIKNVENYTQNLSQNQQSEENSTIMLRGAEENQLNIAKNESNVNADKVTGLSSNLPNDEKSTQQTKNKKGIFKKSSSKNEVTETTETEKQVKSSTKKVKEKKEKPAKVNKPKINQNLIFLHRERQNAAQSQSQTQQVQTEQQTTQTVTTPQAQLPDILPPVQQTNYSKIDTSNLPPLDEITPPKLDDGYSIHREYDFGGYGNANSDLPL